MSIEKFTMFFQCREWKSRRECFQRNIITEPLLCPAKLVDIKWQFVDLSCPTELETVKDSEELLMFGGLCS